MYQLGDKLSLYGMTDVVAIPQASTPIGTPFSRLQSVSFEVVM